MALDVKTTTRTQPHWIVNPFEEIYSLWGKISDNPRDGSVAHLVGYVDTNDGSVGDFEMDVVFHSGERWLSFREGNRVYFVVPVNPREGVEGAYLRVLKVLREEL